MHSPSEHVGERGLVSCHPELCIKLIGPLPFSLQEDDIEYYDSKADTEYVSTIPAPSVTCPSCVMSRGYTWTDALLCLPFSCTSYTHAGHCATEEAVDIAELRSGD